MRRIHNDFQVLYRDYGTEIGYLKKKKASLGEKFKIFKNDLLYIHIYT